MTKPLSDYQKQMNKDRRMVLSQIKKLVNDESKMYSYNYQNDFQWGHNGKPQIKVNHELIFKWTTFENKI